MAWLKKGTWLINKKEFNIPVVLKSQIITQVSAVSAIKPTWFWAGHLIQCLTIPPIGLVRIEDKINVSTRNSSLFRPQIFEPNYQLKFYKADWIDSLRLTLFEDSMPLSTTQESVIFPSTIATSSVGSTVPVSASSVVLLPANSARKKYQIENTSAVADLFIDFAPTCSVVNHGQKITRVSPGGSITTWIDDSYTGVISGIWSAAGAGAALIREFI
jgi:hypothetical protein